MTSDFLKQLTNQLINKEKWQDILQHFIDVIRINIFIVDAEGKTLLPPVKGRYGAEFLENKDLGFDLNNEKGNFLSQFTKHGTYLEFDHHFDLQSFAIPINIEDGKTIAYMIVGPVALNKKLTAEEYSQISQKFKVDASRVVDILNEIRVVSYMTIKSILDLLSEVAKYVIQLSLQGQKFQNIKFDKEILSQQVTQAAQDIYSSICLDELLVTLLDVALSMTKAECGSIMIADKNKKKLSVKVSRGLSDEWIRNAQVRVGEGVSGISFRDNTPFIIQGTEGDSRIKHLLKRPEIKHALVMPIGTENSVFGILNLHTKNEENSITEESLNLVQNLSRLTTAAINSIQQTSQSST